MGEAWASKGEAVAREGEAVEQLGPTMAVPLVPASDRTNGLRAGCLLLRVVGVEGGVQWLSGVTPPGVGLIRYSHGVGCTEPFSRGAAGQGGPRKYYSRARAVILWESTPPLTIDNTIL